MSDSPPDTVTFVNSIICSFIHLRHIDGALPVSSMVLGFEERTKSKPNPVSVLLKLLS